METSTRRVAHSHLHAQRAVFSSIPIKYLTTHRIPQHQGSIPSNLGPFWTQVMSELRNLGIAPLEQSTTREGR